MRTPNEALAKTWNDGTGRYKGYLNIIILQKLHSTILVMNYVFLLYLNWYVETTEFQSNSQQFFFMKLESWFWKLCEREKGKKIKQNKVFLNNWGRFVLANMKQYYDATLTKIMWYYCRYRNTEQWKTIVISKTYRHIDQWNRIVISKIFINIWNLICGKVAMQVNGERMEYPTDRIDIQLI